MATGQASAVAGLDATLALGEIGALSAALRRGRISALELAERTLERLSRIGPEFHALATATPERARLEARRADARIRAGTAGPLCGIPYGAKDLIAAEDISLRGGSPARDDAAVVRRLRGAGAVLAAKLAVENAGGGWSRLGAVRMVGGDGRRPEVRGRPFGFGVNPWDRTRWSGGSSSGSAIAVAVGLVPFALGTETSGSVIGPAAFCGLTALRASYGALSLDGVVPLAWTLDKVGIFARSAADCALVFAALGGRSAGPGAHATLRRRNARARIRVGLAEEDLDRASAAARPALERGIAELRALGPAFARATIPDLPYGAMVETVMRAEGATTFADLIASRLADLVTPRQREGIEAGLQLPARDYLRVMREREAIAAAFDAIFAECDVIAAPAQPRTAPPLAELRAREALGGSRGAQPPAGATGNSGIVAAGNLAGLPAVVVPCGLGTDGLPVGLQLVGPRRSEALLLGLAVAYQEGTAHHRLRPAPRS